MKTREEMLVILLKPIEWNWSSSIRARINLVCERMDLVSCAYPFMNDEEKQQADAWLKVQRKRLDDLTD